MAHELPGLRPRSRQAKPIGDIVQPALEQLQQGLARDAALPLSRLEVPAELILENAVNTCHLLLFTKLHAVADELRLARLAMLSRREVALLDGTLLRVAALSLEEKLHSFSPAQPAHRTYISRHLLVLYTRRRF